MSATATKPRARRQRVNTEREAVANANAADATFAPREPVTEMMTFRMTPSEVKAIMLRAKAEGIEVSNLIRAAIGAYMKTPAKTS